jgi:hypothetical protein
LNLRDVTYIYIFPEPVPDAAVALWQQEEQVVRPVAVVSLILPAKNDIFEPFIYKNDHFAKTGSGQT